MTEPADHPLAALLRLAPDATPLELAELLWLGALLPAQAPRPATDEHVEPPPPPQPLPETPETPRTDDAPAAEALLDATTGVPPDGAALPQGQRRQGRITRPASATPRLLWHRCLHHLAPQRPTGRPTLDVHATVQLLARTGELVVQTRRELEPAAALFVLDDRAASSAPWLEEIDTLTALATASGRWTRVERHALRSSQRVPLGDDPTAAHLPAVQTADTLTAHLRAQPRGTDDVTVVLSDGVAAGWRDGTVARVLDAAPGRRLWAHLWAEERLRQPGLGRLARTHPDAGVVLVPFTPAGLMSARDWLHGRGGDLDAVCLPAPSAGPPAAAPMPSWSDLARRVEVGVPVEVRQILALAAGVPGDFDLDLLRALGERIATRPILPVHLSQALTSGLVERVLDAPGLVIRFRGDDDGDAGARAIALRWLDPPRAEALLQALTDHLDDGAADALGIPYALLLSLRGQEVVDGVAPRTAPGAATALRGLVRLTRRRVERVERWLEAAKEPSSQTRPTTADSTAHESADTDAPVSLSSGDEFSTGVATETSASWNESPTEDPDVSPPTSDEGEVPYQVVGSTTPPRVFISYSHDSPAHAAAVLRLADNLRASGIDAHLDQYDPFPKVGWPAWMREKLAWAQKIIAVCTPTYKERFEQHNPAGVGLGASSEGLLAELTIYGDRYRLGDFVPVLLDGASADAIPTLMRGLTFHALRDGAPTDSLLRHLIDAPSAIMPSLGPLSPFTRRSDGLTAPASTGVSQESLVDQLASALARKAPAEELIPLHAALRASRKKSDVDLAPGDVLGGRFHLVRRLGHGGVSTVWSAFQTLSKGRVRQVALKVLHPHHLSDPTVLERFRKAAADHAAIEDRGVVRVLEPWCEADGRCWIVLEMLTGGDLDHVVRQGAMLPADAVRICLEVGRTLARLHANHFVHADVKPANILLTADRQPRLADFDLAANLAMSMIGSTRRLGDPLFSCPEQADDEEVTPLWDVYALSVTALWCSSGGTLTKRAKRKGQYPDLPLPEPVVAALKRGAATDPEERTPDMATWCREVEQALRAWDLRSLPDEATNYPNQGQASLNSSSSDSGDRIAIRPLRVTAPIGPHAVSISEAEVVAALHPAVTVNDLTIRLGTAITATAVPDAYWALDALRREMTRAEPFGPPFAVFAIAPTPTLVALGSLLRERFDATVYERHRHHADHHPAGPWSWDDNSPELAWAALRITQVFPGKTDVVLILSVSGIVDRSAIAAAIPPWHPIYEVALERPQVDVIRTQAHLRSFIEQWRAALDHIRLHYGSKVRVHVFAAVPGSVAVECGRQHHQDDPALRIYEWHRDRYVFALSVTAGGVDLTDRQEALPPTSIESDKPEYEYRIFISYSNDNPTHAAAVLALAQRLRREGFDAWIDQFEPDPAQGWAAWMRDQIDRADHILIVPTETYQRRFYGREGPDVGKGVRWEGLILTDRLYHSRPLHLRAVLVGDAHERWIPDVIGTHTFYRDADDLLRNLRGEAGPTPAPLAELTVHPISAAAAATRSRHELEGFLRERFTFPELDRHLAHLGLDDLRANLPNGHHVGRNTYITQFVDAISRTGALANRDWWNLLRVERPVFSAEIDALQTVVESSF